MSGRTVLDNLAEPVLILYDVSIEMTSLIRRDVQMINSVSHTGHQVEPYSSKKLSMSEYK